MITQREYKKYPETHWKGLKVRTLSKMQNGSYVIPAGTILVIKRKYKGFSLEGLEVCEHCKIGMRIFIGRVEPYELELI